MPDQPTEFAEIGQRLQALRTGLSNLSQKDWAEKHAIGVTQWNNWERGVRKINLDDAIRLCDTYGLSLDWIYKGRRDALPAALRDRL